MYIDDASAIPLYDRGSLGSAVLALGIGLIIFLPQDEGIRPVSKHTLNKTCKNKTDVSFLRTSTGIKSTPKAFPFFALSNALFTSIILK